MKHRFVLLGVLILIGATLALPVTTLAGSMFRFRGDSAQAYFYSEDGSIITDAFVFATDGRQQSPPGSPGNSSWADIWVSKYDHCNGIQLLVAYGATALDDADFQVQGKQLNSATLNATIGVYDYVSESSFDVAVDLDWASTGTVSRQNSRSHVQQSPQCKFNSRFSGSFRPAEAAGIVSDGVTNYASQSSSFAEIQSVKSGDATIGCN